LLVITKIAEERGIKYEAFSFFSSLLILLFIKNNVVLPVYKTDSPLSQLNLTFHTKRRLKGILPSITVKNFLEYVQTQRASTSVEA
ncbi:hypothetical protein, partial [Metallosphaera sp.]|uniref:hypothetical protein n=1 Tax=Metallosphaera sp. TaxID=2020860 RepID=UPI00316C69AF